MKITKSVLKHIIAEELKEAAQEGPDLGYDPVADVFGVPQGDAEDFAAADRLRKGSTALPSGQETMSPEDIEDRMRAQAEDLGIDPEVYMAHMRKKAIAANSPPIKESKMKLTSQRLKDLIKEELAEQKKPEYKGSESAASRLKKSIGSDEEPADEPAAKKEKSPLEKAKDRLARAKAKGEPARIKSAEAAVKREKKKAGLPESIRRVSKSTLYRIIQEELQNVMEQRPLIPDDAFDFPDDSAYDAEGGEAATPEEAAAYEKKRGRQSSERQKAAQREMDQAKPGDEGYNQSTQGNWKANAYMQAGVGRGAFEAALAPAKPEVKAALLKAFDAKNFKAIKKWAYGQ